MFVFGGTLRGLRANVPWTWQIKYGRVRRYFGTNATFSWGDRVPVTNSYVWIMEFTTAIAIQSNNFFSRIFDQLKSVSSAILLSSQLTGAVFISFSMFQVDAASQSFDTNFMVMLGVTMVAILAVYPCCYFSSRITEKLNQTSTVIYSSVWYSLPIEQQKYIPFMIAFAQRDHAFRGMNMMTCSLESFVQVICLQIESLRVAKRIIFRS